MDGDRSSSITGGDGRVTIDVALHDPAWLKTMPEAAATAGRACLAALDRACPGPALVVSLVLSDDDRVRTLNRDWRGKDAPTNVLSFPALDCRPGEVPALPEGMPADAGIELGDVILARQTVERECDAAGTPGSHHLSHLVVHGSLHLLGYDHETDDEAEIMEALERNVLAGLGIPDPYA